MDYFFEGAPARPVLAALATRCDETTHYVNDIVGELGQIGRPR
jgi:hypothetical protein